MRVRVWIPNEWYLRQQVIERAKNCCEYCLLHSDFMFYPAEIDHIYARKHGGTDEPDNLCLSCFFCNRHKGSDLASIHPETKDIVRLFHPRRDEWTEHFRLNRQTGTIEGITDTGLVTVNLLKLNADRRLLERSVLIVQNLYP